MAELLKEVLADSKVNESELAALFKRYDINGDGVLDRDEQLVLARDVAVMTGSSVDNVIAILDFYERDWDRKIDGDELRSFLEVYVSD
mgnify:CR=1 FL=1